MINMPGIERKNINKFEYLSNKKEKPNLIKYKNTETNLFKEKKEKNIYPEQMTNNNKSYNNLFNNSSHNDLENIQNKKYIENATFRLNQNTSDKPTILNQKKVNLYDDKNINNIYNDINMKKNIQKIGTKKISFIGIKGKRSKLLFYENKNGFVFNNNINITEKKVNLKPIIEIKEKHYNGRNKRQLNKINLVNKNFSSLELRPKNNSLTQNDAITNDRNIILNIQKNIEDNNININEIKETRNKSTNGTHNKEKNNIQINQKLNEKHITKNKIQSKQIIDAINPNSDIANILNLKEKFKSLTSKEKAYFILTQSNILQLSERIIFSRATENLRSLISIKEIINCNEIFIKEKLKHINLNLISYNKQIEKQFHPSKTADISLNIIKNGDEDIFKDFFTYYKNVDESEQKCYQTYISLLFILLGEDLSQINYENINSKLLYEKLKLKGYNYFKDYLYDNFIKKPNDIMKNEKYMDDFSKFFISLPELIRVSGINKSNKFMCFIYFLLKEINDYWNNLKKLIDIKNKTQSYFDFLKRKYQI